MLRATFSCIFFLSLFGAVRKEIERKKCVNRKIFVLEVDKKSENFRIIVYQNVNLPRALNYDKFNKTFCLCQVLVLLLFNLLIKIIIIKFTADDVQMVNSFYIVIKSIRQWFVNLQNTTFIRKKSIFISKKFKNQ